MSKFELVKGFYEASLWSVGMVWNAVGRWITGDEFRDITGKEYEKE